MIAVRVAVCLGLGFILLNRRIVEKTIMQNALCVVQNAMLTLMQEILTSEPMKKVGEVK